MRIVAALRDGPNLTNVRTEALVEALKSHGHEVELIGRNEIVKGADLLIQTGFAASNALRSQIDANMPYIVMEAPFWRYFYDQRNASSWGYNGLAGGAYTPQSPSEEREKPPLLPLRVDLEGTIIVGQKPTDHSLRGDNHVSWIKERLAEFPDAEFRPHPLMVTPGSLEPVERLFGRYGHWITYTSTVGCEALVAGCRVRADHPSSLAYNVQDREVWHHDLSWRQARHGEFGPLIPYILSGYEEARALSEAGRVERPREKVTGQQVQLDYYAILESR